MNISDKCAVIIGCGGLGCFVIEEIARFGVGKLILVDGDKFSKSNMNRQLLATYDNIGKYKAQLYAERVKQISSAEVEYHNEYFDDGNYSIIEKADIVFDCVDNFDTRKKLSAYAKQLGKTVVHGAIEGEEGQIIVSFPDDDSFDKFLSSAEEIEHATNSYSVATVASIQAGIGTKVLSGDGNKYRGKLVLVDMDEPTVKVLDF
ncbi:MAG: ThiF family adenylyltransferase [Clostridia bacterium]|nr:ThiF family adenylyltransferase [Clostridia bacterium]